VGHAVNGCSRRFQVRVSTVCEAQSFLDLFYRKFGSLAGELFVCSETGTEGPADGPYIARIELTRWPYDIGEERVDFEKLLAETKATEIVS
jgi:hypothetical protein